MANHVGRFIIHYVDGLVQDCSISIANALTHLYCMLHGQRSVNCRFDAIFVHISPVKDGIGLNHAIIRIKTGYPNLVS